MDDFTLLQVLQKELIETLKARKSMVGQDVTRNVCCAKIRRLRLQLQEVMLRIERKCSGYWRLDKENWYK